ncbi:folate family ECF transporter S component [Oceanobacillus sp. CAU 1775]
MVSTKKARATTMLGSKITTKQLTITAGLIAINLVLNQFTLSFGPLLEVGFAFLPIAVLAYLYGPLNAGIASVVADTLGFVLRPAGFFFPGFTLSALLMGIIYGLFFYKKEITLLRVALALLVTSIVFSLILTPIWLNIMFGSALVAVPRIIKTLLLYPIEVGLLFALLKGMRPLKDRLN